MKHFLMVCFVPMTLAAQNMQQLTEQLGKTVLYGDIALSRPTPRTSHGCNQPPQQHRSRRISVRFPETRRPKLVDIPDHRRQD